MDLVAGENMCQHLKDKGPPKSIEIIKEMGRQLISGISYLHSQNIVHLDIKPSNIMLMPNNTKLKLIDLGIAKKIYNYAG